jgi:hypothetical protein
VSSGVKRKERLIRKEGKKERKGRGERSERTGHKNDAPVDTYRFEACLGDSHIMINHWRILAILW